MNETMYYDRLAFKEYYFSLVVSQQGLAYLGLHDESPAQLEAYFAKQKRPITLVQAPHQTATYRTELLAYLAGERQAFTFPVDFGSQGTEFQRQVWQALLAVPYGTSSSYGALAAAIGRPQAYRAVGSAVGKNPISLVIPCHRILRQDGRLGGYGGGLPLKKDLLSLEQIPWR